MNISIGVSGPFSGKRKAYGDLIIKCTQQVKEELSINNQVDFIFKDDKANVETAIDVANCFIENKVNAVIGHFNSACAQAVSPLYHANKMLFIAPASTTINLPYENRGYIYRLCPNNKEQIEILNLFCLKNSIQHLGIVTDNSAYANELLELTKSILIDKRLTLVNLNIINQNLDAIWFIGTHFSCIESTKTIINNFKGGMLPFIYCDDCFIDEFINHFDKKSEKITIIGSDGGYEKIYRTGLKTLVLNLLNNTNLPFNKTHWTLYNLNSRIHG
jgi:branched-chain amino acid transport system substrate-binding protein